VATTRRPLAETRELLIAAAIRVIARQGLAAASTRAITAEAGVPLSSFHYAFESYDHLIDRLIETVVDGERRAGLSATDLPTAVTGDLEAVVRDGLVHYAHLLFAHPEHEQAMLELSAHLLRTPGLEHRARDQYAAYYASAEAVLRRGAALTGSRWSMPVGHVARLLVLLTDSITTTWLADRDSAAALEAARFAAAAIARLATPAREPALAASPSLRTPFAHPAPHPSEE
jgi:AcrR family transcriptional regulator